VVFEEPEMTVSMKKSEYLASRRRCEPEQVRLIVIAESPPDTGLYFYNPTGRPTEPLFSALMKQLGVSCLSKEQGLREFQRSGWVLVDATYEPVNGIRRDSQRNTIIERDYPALRDDLIRLTSDRSVPLILLKVNVCRILEPKLAQDRFTVLNRGIEPPFPSHGQQNGFHERFGAILDRAAIRSHPSPPRPLT
jgi:hypothetical protein